MSLPGLVSLRRFVGSRNRPLAALAPVGQRSFPRAAGLLVPASPTLSFLCPLGNILAARPAGVPVPFLCGADT